MQPFTYATVKIFSTPRPSPARSKPAIKISPGRATIAASSTRHWNPAPRADPMPYVISRHSRQGWTTRSLPYSFAMHYVAVHNTERSTSTMSPLVMGGRPSNRCVDLMIE